MDISFFENVKHFVPHCLTPSHLTAPRKARFSLSASAQSRYYLKTIYPKLLLLMSFGSSFETITKQGLHSVVEKLLPKRKAFTLAEVLIVLGIIGLIADMTIPTLISSTQEKIAVAKLKKAYSTFESAYRLAVVENGTPENWNLIAQNSKEGANNIIEQLSPYLNIVKKFTEPEDNSCFQELRRLNGQMHGDDSATFSEIYLADGTKVGVQVKFPNCNGVYTTTGKSDMCATIDIDIDGKRGKNQIGVDFFMFYITKNGIVPLGIADDTFASFDNTCKDKSTAHGYGCAAWVIYNENMDYLHCDDLSWNGKKKCD